MAATSAREIASDEDAIAFDADAIAFDADAIAFDADADSFRAIDSSNNLSKLEKLRIKNMVQEAIEISEPGIKANDEHLTKAFKLVFSSDWGSDTPPSPPVLRQRLIRDTSIAVGTFNRDLNPRDLVGDGEFEAQDPGQMAQSTPRKRARTTKATSTAVGRTKGSVAMMRARVRPIGLIDVYFHDIRGTRAPEDAVAFYGPVGTVNLGKLIARAANHFDKNEVDRINSFNQKLMTFKIRRYIYFLATGKELEGDEVQEYEKLVLIGQAMEIIEAIWDEYLTTNQSRPIQKALLN